jgi:hypothetical protein
MVRLKVLVTKEVTPYISADTRAKWWVEPNDVALPISVWLLWCVLSVAEFMIEVAMYEGADSWNVCSSDKSSAMRLLIDVGTCLVMLGGWLKHYLCIVDCHWASYRAYIFHI